MAVMLKIGTPLQRNGRFWAVKSIVQGAARRIARALWKTKSSKKRSLQSLKVVQHALATLSATGGGGFSLQSGAPAAA